MVIDNFGFGLLLFLKSLSPIYLSPRHKTGEKGRKGEGGKPCGKETKNDRKVGQFTFGIEVTRVMNHNSHGFKPRMVHHEVTVTGRCTV